MRSPTGLTCPAPPIYGKYFESLPSAFAFEQELPSDRESAEPVINAMFSDPTKQARCLSYLSWNKERERFMEAHAKVMIGRLLFVSASRRFVDGGQVGEAGGSSGAFAGSQCPIYYSRGWGWKL